MRQRRPRRSKPRGFSEEGVAYATDADARARGRQIVELGAGGRLVIPAPMRAALGMKIGDRLTVRLDGNELRVHTYEEGLRQAREIVAKYLPANADPVDDFLEWKREQAKLEQAKYETGSRGE